MKYRVLLIESMNDRLSRERARMMECSPQLGDLILEHYYPVVFTPEELKLIDSSRAADQSALLDEANLWLSRETPLLLDDLLSGMEDVIRIFNPQFIILHAGIVFYKHPDIFLIALGEIRKNNPKIRIGCDSNTIHKIEDIFDHDDITKGIVDQIWHKRL